MRRTTVSALAAVLALAGHAWGQAPAAGSPPQKAPPAAAKPTQLEEQIAQALRENPDVRVAEAKMREAEAELTRARMIVVQKVVALQHSAEAAARAVNVAEARVMAADAQLQLADRERSRAEELVKTRAAPQEIADVSRAKLAQAAANREAARADLLSAKADQAKVQAELPYLLGKQPRGVAQAEFANISSQAVLQSLHEREKLEAEQQKLYLSRIHAAERLFLGTRLTQPPQGTLADKIRKALDTTNNISLRDQPLGDVLAHLQEMAGVPFVDDVPREMKAKKITLRLDGVPLGAALQAVEDVAHVHFGVRDYGVLVTDDKLPASVLPLHVFWKGLGDAKTKPGEGDKEPKKP